MQAAQVGAFCVKKQHPRNDITLSGRRSFIHEAEHIKPGDADVWKPLDFYFEPVVIDDHTLVCSGTVIIPGVHVGHHSMIGGGAIVIGDIPPYSPAVGCPARAVRRLRDDEASKLESGTTAAK